MDARTLDDSQQAELRISWHNDSAKLYTRAGHRGEASCGRIDRGDIIRKRLKGAAPRDRGLTFDEMHRRVHNELEDWEFNQYLDNAMFGVYHRQGGALSGGLSIYNASPMVTGPWFSIMVGPTFGGYDDSQGFYARAAGIIDFLLANNLHFRSDEYEPVRFGCVRFPIQNPIMLWEANLYAPDLSTYGGLRTTVKSVGGKLVLATVRPQALNFMG